jgi:integrase
VLPSGVHQVISRGREYFYFQARRGTNHAGPRVRLPNDPHAPEFWQAIRQAQGIVGPVPNDTVGALIDGYLTSPPFLGVSAGTQYQYRRGLEVARRAWGALAAAGLRPVHIQGVMDALAATPSKANSFLGTIRALSAWARARDLIPHSLHEGVKPYARTGGHQPWTPEQIRAAHTDLAGIVRRGIMLYLYTGQRGSDVVRLGWTDVDDGGFRLRQRKTGREVWCPIVPELAAEMATWERRPGPFLLQDSGRPYTRALFWKRFDEARAELPVFAGATLHGLRCTAVVRLRRASLSTGQIGDITGMSLAMIERYCRFADRKASGQAALITLARTAAEQDCKTLANRKTETQ